MCVCVCVCVYVPTGWTDFGKCNKINYYKNDYMPVYHSNANFNNGL